MMLKIISTFQNRLHVSRHDVVGNNGCPDEAPATGVAVKFKLVLRFTEKE